MCLDISMHPANPDSNKIMEKNFEIMESVAGSGRGRCVYSVSFTDQWDSSIFCSELRSFFCDEEEEEKKVFVYFVHRLLPRRTNFPSSRSLEGFKM